MSCLAASACTCHALLHVHLHVMPCYICIYMYVTSCYACTSCLATSTYHACCTFICSEQHYCPVVLVLLAALKPVMEKAYFTSTFSFRLCQCRHHSKSTSAMKHFKSALSPRTCSDPALGTSVALYQATAYTARYSLFQTLQVCIPY